MPFIARCPFCSTQVNAPDKAVGYSIPCPRCGSHFTLAPIQSIPAPARAATAATAAIVPAPPPTVPHDGPRLPPAPAPVFQQPEPTAPAPDWGPLLLDSPTAPGQRWVRLVGIAALFVGSLALLFASIPFLNWLTLPLSGLGLLLGLVGVTGGLS